MLFGKNVNFSSTEWAVSEALLRLLREDAILLESRHPAGLRLQQCTQELLVHEKLTSSSFCPGGPVVIGFNIKQEVGKVFRRS